MTGSDKTSLRVLFIFLFIVLAATAVTACRPTEQATGPTETALPTMPAAPRPGDWQQAAAYWQHALDTAPDDPAAHYQLGLLYLVLDRENAAAHLQQAAAMDPALGENVRRLEAALRQSRAVEDPAYQQTIIGQALASVGEWPLAETALETAVAQDPDYAEAWAYLGEVRQHTDKENAFEALQTALELDRQSYAANLFTSFYWKRSGKPARALPHLKTALQQDPTNLSLQEDLAITLVQAGQVETAFETINALLEESPENPELWLILARLSIENDLQVSQVGLPAARQAVLLKPEDPQPAILLGRAYALANDPVLAERFLLRAVRQAPHLAEPHLYLGLLYLNRDNFPAARSELEKARALAENNAEEAVYLLAGQLLDQYFP